MLKYLTLLPFLEAKFTLDSEFTEYSALKFYYNDREVLDFPTFPKAGINWGILDYLQISNGKAVALNFEGLNFITYNPLPKSDLNFLFDTDQIKFHHYEGPESYEYYECLPAVGSTDLCKLFKEENGFGVFCGRSVAHFNDDFEFLSCDLKYDISPINPGNYPLSVENIVDIDDSDPGYLHFISRCGNSKDDPNYIDFQHIGKFNIANKSFDYAYRLDLGIDHTELRGIKICGKTLAVATSTGMNYTSLPVTEDSTWKWDYDSGLLDGKVMSLACQDDILYIGSTSFAGINTREEFVESIIGENNAMYSQNNGFYSRIDGFYDKYPNLGNISSIKLTSDYKAFASKDGISISYKNSAYRYFQGPKWFVGQAQRIESFYDSLETTVFYIQTTQGLSFLILDHEMTLTKKSDTINHWLSVQAEGKINRMNLFSDQNLYTPGDPKSLWYVPRDNDGLWTAMYASGKLFELLSTYDQETEILLNQALDGLSMIYRVTGTSGFPARSYDLKENDPAQYGGIWHYNEDLGLEWKADTSSDEIVGHFLITTLITQYYQPRSKEFARYQIEMMDYIVDNNYTLIDGYTKERTLWGFWDPEALLLTPDNYSERLSNSVEILAFLVASANTCLKYPDLCKHDFMDNFHELYYGYNYKRILKNIVSFNPEERNFSDDELIFQAILTLYLGNPNNLIENSIFDDVLDSYEKTIIQDRGSYWGIVMENIGRETNTNLDLWVYDLQTMSVDQLYWAMDNSIRQDIVLNKEKVRVGKDRTYTRSPFLKSEMGYLLWNGSPYEITHGNNLKIYPGTVFNLPFWLLKWDSMDRPSYEPPTTTSTTTSTSTTSETAPYTETTSSTVKMIATLPLVWLLFQI